MAKYRKKPVVVEAITFEEFVKIGLSQEGKEGVNIVDGEPWAFKYQGFPITQENSECYIIPTLEGYHNFTPKDMLITGIKGEIYPCKIDIFNSTYDEVIEVIYHGKNGDKDTQYVDAAIIN